MAQNSFKINFISRIEYTFPNLGAIVREGNESGTKSIFCKLHSDGFPMMNLVAPRADDAKFFWCHFDLYCNRLVPLRPKLYQSKA